MPELQGRLDLGYLLNAAERTELPARAIGVVEGTIEALVIDDEDLVILAWTFLEDLVLPLLVNQVPRCVNDVTAIPGRRNRRGLRRGPGGGQPGVGRGVPARWLLFGIAMFRGRVLARRAAPLLAAGTAVTIAVVISHAATRATAIPVGIALAGLGHCLWREQHAKADPPVPSPVSWRLDPAGAE